MNIFNRLINYLKGTRTELKYVNWPTKKQAANFTIIVIAVSLITAAILGFFDVSFSALLDRFIL